MRERKSIAVFFIRSLATVAVLSFGIVGALWVMCEFFHFENMTSRTEREHLRLRKQIIRSEINRVVSMVDGIRREREERLRERIRHRVYNAHAVAGGLFRSNPCGSGIETRTAVKEALRDVKFPGNERYFINSLDGDSVLFPSMPQLEGSSASGIRDSAGNYIVKDEQALLRNENEGFVRHFFWHTATDSKLKSRISFVKKFKPYSWYIGASAFNHNVEKEMQRDVLSMLGSIRYGRDGFLFVVDERGKVLSHIDSELNGKDGLEIVDPEGVRIVEELIKSASTNGGGFLTYIAPVRPSTGTPSRKVSYAKSINGWNWVVGTGIYLDDLENELKEQRSIILNEVGRHSSYFFLGFSFLVLLTFFMTRRFYNRIRSEFDRFTEFFGNAATEMSPMEDKGFQFSEFADLSRSANEMVAKRKKAKLELEKYRKELERLVRERTAELRETETLFEQMFNQSPAGLVVVGSDDGKIRMVNPKVFDIFNIDSSMNPEGLNIEALAPVWDKFIPDYAQGLNGDSVLHLAVKGVFVEPAERSFIRWDGEEIWIRVSGVPIHDAGGSVVAGMAIIDDITKLKSAEAEGERIREQLIQAQKMDTVGSLISGFVHDFNNVIGGITGSLSLLKFQLKSLNVGEKLEAHLNRAMESAGRAVDMIERIQRLTRKANISKKPADLKACLENVFRICEENCDRSIEHTIKLPDGRADVFGDTDCLEQLFLNLLMNAAHAMTIMRPEGEKNGGTLEVVLGRVASDDVPAPVEEKKSDSYWRVDVKDNGVGMDVETARRIFDPFFSTKRKEDGIGLGLSTVYAIVREHKGFIDVKSEPGKGSTFTVFIPKCEEECTEDKVKAAEPVRSKGGTILVIDDEEIIRSMAEMMLKEGGYEILLAEDGARGVEIYGEKAAEIEAVILDMSMPKMDGKETYLALREIDADVKVLMASGYRFDRRVTECLEIGVNGFVKKPFTMEELLESVGKLFN